MVISRPISLRRSCGDMASRFIPSKIISSAVIVAVSGKSPMTASMDTDLPEPDSPTIASTSCLSTETSMPLTAVNAPVAVANLTVRFLIFSRLIA